MMKKNCPGVSYKSACSPPPCSLVAVPSRTGRHACGIKMYEAFSPALFQETAPLSHSRLGGGNRFVFSQSRIDTCMLEDQRETSQTRQPGDVRGEYFFSGSSYCKDFSIYFSKLLLAAI